MSAYVRTQLPSWNERERGGNEFVEHLLTFYMSHELYPSVLQFILISALRDWQNCHSHSIDETTETSSKNEVTSSPRPHILRERESKDWNPVLCVSSTHVLFPLPHFLFSTQPPGWMLLICKIHICCTVSGSN